MSAKRSVGEKVLGPVIAAGTSLVATYLVKKGPQFVEETVLPWLRDAAQGAGGVAERLPDKARSAAGGAGGLAEELTEKARDVGGGGGSSSSESGRSLSQDELSQRSEERAKHRAQRRKSRR